MGGGCLPLVGEMEKLSKNECFTASFSFKLFALGLKVLFNVILHEVTVSAGTS